MSHSCSCNMPCTNSRFYNCQEHTVAANCVEGFSRPDQLVSVREALYHAVVLGRSCHMSKNELSLRRVLEIESPP
jgi:hypothetical protein